MCKKLQCNKPCLKHTVLENPVFGYWIISDILVPSREGRKTHGQDQASSHFHEAHRGELARRPGYCQLSTGRNSL